MNCNLSIDLFIHFVVSVYFNLAFHLFFHGKFTEAKHYHTKLVNIRKEMLMLHEKTSKLKKRALKLQQKRQKEELEREQQREKEFEREKQLTAKPAKRT
ncbi:biogenesis of lysosomal organelles complex 1 subunit 6 [Phyllostomus discolor]|uniref:Biogenesis of lysosomal organelles complex 1 subunit 6 n=1 Tax=Phyllostomus discolor TaxID=89673 RepID=A0A834ETQ7_9CHIR|nr:biogenesis of lysosomal organelles complex 1 subunit 6 [Phyllostomus discolor]